MFDQAVWRLDECTKGQTGFGGNAASRPLPARRQMMLLCRFLLVAEIAVFMFFVAGTHGLIVPLERPTSTDFVSFYAAGRLANAGTPYLAYNESQHYAAEQQTTAPGITYNFFYYPPTFLLLCAALAHLPYIPAFITFEFVTLVFYGLVVRRILDERGLEILIPILAFPPVLWTIGLGQNGFLTAGLFGAATLLIDRRPAVAGLLFGGLCCKPHFALLVPFALAAGGRWRALGAALIASAGCCLLSLLVFGWQTWLDFFAAAARSSHVYTSGRIPFAGFITPFGAASLLGATPQVAGAVQGIAAVIAMAAVVVVWRRNLPLPIRAATLAAGTLVAVPLALFYDLVLAGVAAAWLLRSKSTPALSRPLMVLLPVLYVLCLDPRGAANWRLPLGLVITLVLLTLTGIIGWRGRLATPARPISGSTDVAGCGLLQLSTSAATDSYQRLNIPDEVGGRDIAVNASTAGRVDRAFRTRAAS